MLDSDLAELYGVETKVLKRGSKAEQQKVPCGLYVSAE